MIRVWRDPKYKVEPLRPAKTGDGGLDLQCVEGFSISPRGKCLAYTGLKVKVPEGWIGLVTGRSSTFGKLGLLVIQGVIDSGYTGPLYAVVHNPSDRHLTVGAGSRLAQLVVIPHFTYEGGILEVEEMPETARGSTGFGSTGA